MDASGANLSGGEAQLLCLARALLRRPRLVLVDEATALLDPGTDELLQATMHELFRDAGASVLHIAHRLRAVCRSHRIVVLASGRVVEQGTPLELLLDPSSQLAQMAAPLGKGAAELVQLARESSEPNSDATATQH